MNCVALGALVTVLGLGLVGAENYPEHASCRVYWTIGIPCSLVKLSLINQIDEWSTDENCANGGEKCLYQYVDSNSTTLTATHATPVQHYIDNLVLQFMTPATSPDGRSCDVRGYSYSTVSAYLDMGTNYCNLHNLITGAELDNINGYSETTFDFMCTQYSEADCEVY